MMYQVGGNTPSVYLQSKLLATKHGHIVQISSIVSYLVEPKPISMNLWK